MGWVASFETHLGVWALGSEKTKRERLCTDNRSRNRGKTVYLWQSWWSWASWQQDQTLG